MSASDLRERLRKLAERTAKGIEDSQKKKSQSLRSDGDKENSAFTVPTDTRMTRTAPSQLLKHTNMNKTPSIKTPSIPETVSAEVPQKSRIAAAAVAAAAAATAAAAAVRPRTPATSAEPPSTSFAVTDAAAPIATSERAGVATKEPYQIEVSTSRSARLVTKAAQKDENKDKRSASAHTEQSSGAKGSSAAAVEKEAAHALHRSESVSSSRSNRCIHINNRSYVVIDLLGKGGSSKVYQVLDEEKKKLRAVKCVDLSDADDACRSAYLNEIKLLLSLKNSGCVVEMFDYELRGDLLYVVMEKGDIDLATFLKTRRNQIDDIFIRFYWSEMLKCVQTIHKKGIVHSDLKPANFLLVGGNLKLIDFGIASAIPSNKTSVVKNTQMGTLSYMPPEAIAASSAPSKNGKEIYKIRKKSDVWALGCILYNMVYGHTPYQAWTNPVQKMHAILHNPVVFEKIDDTDLMDVLKRCLTKDPEKRASVEELQHHFYLTRKGGVCMDESVVLQDVDFMKAAEDLRSCTPRTSVRKLRELMQKRTTSKNNFA